MIAKATVMKNTSQQNSEYPGMPEGESAREQGEKKCPSSIKNNVLYKTLKSEFEILFRFFFKRLVFKVP